MLETREERICHCVLFQRFIYLIFWLWWVFVAARRLSLVAASRGSSSVWSADLGAQAYGCSTWARVAEALGSRVLAQ